MLSIRSRYTIPLMFVAVVFFCNSCTHTTNFISEGSIDYVAEVIDEAHPLAELAPGSMTLKFKNDKYVAEMSTMGFFTTHFILDLNKKCMIQMVKVLDVRNACIDDENALIQESQDYKLKFTETKETKIIAGYKCKKLIASKVDDPTDKFVVYYTEDLDVKNPNFSNPYSSIKGMLMEYRLKKFGLEMAFRAKSVHKEEVPDSEFDLPPNYKILTRKEMDEFFKNFE